MCMCALVFASFAAQVPSVVNSIVGNSRRVGIVVAAFGGCTNEACVARESGARGDKWYSCMRLRLTDGQAS